MKIFGLLSFSKRRKITPHVTHPERPRSENKTTIYEFVLGHLKVLILTYSKMFGKLSKHLSRHLNEIQNRTYLIRVVNDTWSNLPVYYIQSLYDSWPWRILLYDSWPWIIRNVIKARGQIRSVNMKMFRYNVEGLQGKGAISLFWNSFF